MKTFSIALAAVLAATLSPFTFAQKIAIASSSESVILKSDVNISSTAVKEPDVEEPLYPEVDFTGVAPSEVEFIKGVSAAETAANLRGRLGVGSENEEWYEKDDTVTLTELKESVYEDYLDGGFLEDVVNPVEVGEAGETSCKTSGGCCGVSYLRFYGYAYI